MADTLSAPAYAATLKIPHATDPTITEHVYLSRVCKGAKRTQYRQMGPTPTIDLPAFDTWTLDTMRIVFHSMDCILDRFHQGKLYQSQHEPYDRTYPGIGSVVIRDDRKMVYLVVATTAPDDATRHYEAEIRLDLPPFTPPMLAELRQLATKAPFAIRDLHNPGIAGRGDATEHETLQQVQDTNRLIAKIRAIARDDVPMLNSIEILVNGILKALDLSDDDWKD